MKRFFNFRRLLNVFNFRRLLNVFVMAAALTAATVAVTGAPVGYFNQPGSFQDAVNFLVQEINGQVQSAYYTSCATNTTALNATCNGLQIGVTVNSLTTATNGAVSNSILVNDNLVTAASRVFCQPMGYAGNGIPADVDVAPAAGNFTYAIQNTSVGGASLSGNTTSACTVWN